MTKPIRKKVVCPDCGAEGDFTVYISINFGMNPELFEKMCNIWECPKCGKKYGLSEVIGIAERQEVPAPFLNLVKKNADFENCPIFLPDTLKRRIETG